MFPSRTLYAHPWTDPATICFSYNIAAKRPRKQSLCISETSPAAAKLSGKYEPGPYVQLARFTKSGTAIETTLAHTHEESYFAISHVWGDAAWQKLTCYKHEVYLSAKKKRFIEENLYDIVGESLFWMDIFAVDQNQESQVIAVVKDVPAIFMGAKRTIAIREGDGIYACCAEAIESARSRDDIRSALYNHDHDWKMENRELYLKRFWTLEEVLLSHTIQFATCVENPPELHESRGEDEQDVTTKHSLYDNMYLDETGRVVDALHCLAIGFSLGAGAGHMEDEMIFDFMHAYITCGTVTRIRDTAIVALANPLSPQFQHIFAYSERKSSKPRDYIFALMAQFPCYRFLDDAKWRTFMEVFLDFDLQARRAKTGFACRITQSMTSQCSAGTAWAPSPNLPEPTCLGDFVLMLGNPLDQPPRADLPGPMHLVTLVGLTDPLRADDTSDESSDGGSGNTNISPDGSTPSSEHINKPPSSQDGVSEYFLEIITAAMEFSHPAWNLSERAGELSKHGSWPDMPFHTRVRPWLDNLEKLGNTPKSIDVVRQKFSDELRKEDRWTSDEEFVIQEAMKTLNLMFGASPRSQKMQRARPDWIAHVREREGKWPLPLRQMMLLIAAMVSCKVPMSATRWASQTFAPVLIWLDKSEHHYLGLLSKRHYDALVSDHAQRRDRVFLASRGYSDSNRGKDIVILDPVSKTPVGLVPDFTHPGIEGQEWTRRLKVLYRRLFVSDCECEKAHFGFLPLDNLDREGSFAGICALLSHTEQSKAYEAAARRDLKWASHPRTITYG